MRHLGYAMMLMMIQGLSACSGDVAKRTAYETLQNMHQRECMQNPAVECGQRESYDDYKKKRDELEVNR